MAKKYQAGQRKIKQSMHSPPKDKNLQKGKKELVTVVESPVERSQVPLEEILRKTEVILEFPEPTDESVYKNLKNYSGRQVYLAELDPEVLVHGVIESVSVAGEYSISYLDRTLSIETDFHRSKDLRKIYVIK